MTGPPGAGLFHSSSGPLETDGVAILSSDGQVVGVSPLDGKRLWSWDSGAHGVDGDGYGPGGYLLDADDGVVVADKGQSYVGLDVAHGKPAWTQSGLSQNGLGPVPSGQGGLIFAYPAGQVGELIDISSGRIEWQHPPPTPTGSSTGLVAGEAYPPVVAAGVVVAPQIDGTAAGSSVATGRTLWTAPESVLQATAAGDLVIVAPGSPQSPSDAVDAIALDAASGQKLWSYGPFDPGGDQFAQLGGALVYTNIGTSNQTGSGEGAPGELARVDPTTGRNLWEVSTSPYKVIAVGNELVSLETSTYALSGDSRYRLVGRDLTSGHTLWTTSQAFGYSSTNQLFTVPSPGGPLVIVLDRLNLTAYAATTGQEDWTLSLPSNYLVDGVTTVGSGLVVQTSNSQYQLGGH